ncbi:ABC transporter ATP-binding protein [Shewanella glacialimarina]|uniref:ABC transporter ATP-binding protein n=1 Tax=Shewanella glacialimarina TaxID=2590884 RepID=UPI001CF81029|nr:ABC transporter ATP-binding protein [Shewanella glacialimarina]UCX06561.1 ABC transporter ATP-binding protein [Shewanella glacialimarina]
MAANAPASIPALVVNQLSWRYDDTQILADISFSLTANKMLGIIGPNGAGKSSLLRCLYRYIAPSCGTISLFGQDINQFNGKAFATQVAVVQQDTPQFFDMNTSQLIAMGLTPHKGMFDGYTADDNQLVNDAINLVGLADKAFLQYGQLSGGEKQRALIARAIVQRPKLLILDEPTNHLDIRYQIQILELVKSLGITVIASIHDLNLASAMCDHLLLLNKGLLVAQGCPTEVLTEAQIGDVFEVCCEVKKHPQHAKPLINYFYGYMPQKQVKALADNGLTSSECEVQS